MFQDISDNRTQKICVIINTYKLLDFEIFINSKIQLHFNPCGRRRLIPKNYQLKYNQWSIFAIGKEVVELPDWTSLYPCPSNLEKIWTNVPFSLLTITCQNTVREVSQTYFWELSVSTKVNSLSYLVTVTKGILLC